MRVGIIGLGRMGEGMSRRMIKEGIEVWGYRRNYQKAQEAYEKGYVSGVTTDIPLLVQEVKKGGLENGIFQLVVPAENVEETINELLPLLLTVEILLLIMAIPILKTVDAGQNSWKTWVSNLLTAVLAVVCLVWSVDTVLWLVVQVWQYLFVPHFGRAFTWHGCSTQNRSIHNIN